MDDKKKNRRGSRLFRFLRHEYQWFLVHFVLGLCTAAVLFLLSFHVSRIAESSIASGMLHSGIYVPKEQKPCFSEVMLRHAVYMLPQTNTALLFVPEQMHSRPEVQHEVPHGGLAPDAEASPEAQKPPSGMTPEELYAAPKGTPDGSAVILPADLSSRHLFSMQNHGILFSNQTAFSPDIGTYLNAPYPIAPTLPENGEPLILILHTHGTEAFSPDGASSVPADYPARSQDITENVVSVGDMLTEVLTEAGLPVLHCKTMFDKESYPQAYSKAASYIRETVSAHPSIQYVFDIHRDALISGETTILRPVTLIGEEISAQVMCVVGTNEAGADHPHWETNLTAAVHLQKRLNDAYPGFARPINLRSAGFNAQYAPGSILLEIGSSGNSLEEARTAAYYLGKQLSALILQSP